jgi:hypothetical protein
MTTSMNPTTCAGCGALIDEPAGLPAADRKPCSSCGSSARNFGIHVHESLTVHEKIGMKQKRYGHKKPIYESLSGDDLHRASGQWNRKTRVIDRENNQYKEVIVNPETGELIRHCDEPLTEHINRGSAKNPGEGGQDA